MQFAIYSFLGHQTWKCRSQRNKRIKKKICLIIKGLVKCDDKS